MTKSYLRGFYLLYSKYHVTVKSESNDSYRSKSPAGRDEHLAEWYTIALPYPIRQAHKCTGESAELILL